MSALLGATTAEIPSMRTLLVSALLVSATVAHADNRLRPGTYSVTRDQSNANMTKKVITGTNAQFAVHGNKVTLGEGMGSLTGATIQLRPVTRYLGNPSAKRIVTDRWVGRAEVYDKNQRAMKQVDVVLAPHTYRGYHAGMKTISVEATTPGGPTGFGYREAINGAAFRNASEKP